MRGFEHALKSAAEWLWFKMRRPGRLINSMDAKYDSSCVCNDSSPRTAAAEKQKANRRLLACLHIIYLMDGAAQLAIEEHLCRMEMVGLSHDREEVLQRRKWGVTGTIKGGVVSFLSPSTSDEIILNLPLPLQSHFCTNDDALCINATYHLGIPS